MSIETTIARVGAIRAAIADPAELVNGSGATGGTAAPAASGTGTTTASPFAAALAQASAGYPQNETGTATTEEGVAGAPSGLSGSGLTSGTTAMPGSIQESGGSGARVAAVAETQIGQSEQPPGSNESPAIAEYRSATAGAMPGEPWCAYFASWAARQAGEPIGPSGQGLGSVSEIWSWAQSAGRAVPNGPGVVPKPGDLIVFGGEHVGIVRGVLPDGRIETVEGNYENKVSANIRSAGEATGYVSMS
jgi:CHAP domain